MSSEASDKGRIRFLLSSFVLIAVLIGVDQVSDVRQGADAVHVGLEGVAMIAALVGAVVLIVGQVRAKRAAQEALTDALGEAEQARARAEALAEEAAHWKGEAEGILRELGQAIDRQFDRWSLSAAEREVALLLLKGLSTKEIAQLRGTSDRTVRQQATGVYRKAGLANRAELAAWFLEDLLLPGG